MKRIIIDTDPGIDDAAAIFFALSRSELQVEILTSVFGNVEIEQCTRNALNLLEISGRADIPVYEGARHPLMRPPNYAKHIHGNDGLGDVQIDLPSTGKSASRAVDAIVATIMDNPHEITLVALGPLTNIALALAVEPKLAQSVEQIVSMGGAVLTWGNVTPAASANIFNDPEAAAMVYKSGAPIVQVGQDVARAMAISHRYLSRIKNADTIPGNFLLQITPFIEKAYRDQGVQAELDGLGVHYNDLTTMAYVVDPTLFETRSLFVEIETQKGVADGATVADFGNRWGKEPNADVCLDVDVERVAELFTQSLVNGGS